MKRDLIFPTEVWHEDATWMSQIYDTPYSNVTIGV